MKTLTIAMEDAVVLATEDAGGWKLETKLADLPEHFRWQHTQGLLIEEV